MHSNVKIPVVLLLLIPQVALALTIETCSSNGNEWECEEGKPCICEIYGDCTNGNLLVYKRNLANLLCAPPIVDSIVVIDWDHCGNPEGIVRVMADCEEGQSKEEVLEIISVVATTTTLPQETTTLPTISTTTTTTVEVIKSECPYECCIDNPYYYDKYCPEGFECIGYECVPLKEEVEEAESNVGSRVLIVVIIIILVIVVILILVKKVPKTYEELYKKWSKIR